MGEVETFNYPRFLLEGFHFLGVAENSVGGVGDADGGFNEVMGEAVRTYTLQARYALSSRLLSPRKKCTFLCTYSVRANKLSEASCALSLRVLPPPPPVPTVLLLCLFYFVGQVG